MKFKTINIDPLKFILELLEYDADLGYSEFEDCIHESLQLTYDKIENNPEEFCIYIQSLILAFMRLNKFKDEVIKDVILDYPEFKKIFDTKKQKIIDEQSNWSSD